MTPHKRLLRLLAKLLQLDRKTKSYLTVFGTSLIYFAMGLYFAAGNTGVYLTSYLIYRSHSDMKLDDAIWFLSAAGFSALLLPVGGWLEGKVGVRAVCLLGGLLQTSGIFATYWVLDTTFFWVVVVYGGSFLVSLASCYTSPMVNVCKWHPKHKGLVTGIGAASMAMAPTLFTPLITSLVNPDNLPANELGLFEDAQILDRTKSSTIVQGLITMSLFALGILMTFPAPNKNNGDDDDDDDDDAASKQQQQQPAAVSLTKYKPLEEADHLATTSPISFVSQTGPNHWRSSWPSRSFEVTGDGCISCNGCKSFDTSHSSSSKFKKQQIFSVAAAGAADVDSMKQVGDNLQLAGCSLEPRFALRTLEFWLLSLKVLITELIFIYLLFMYKPYGQTFIRDDYFLSGVGAACAVSNTLGRLSMGHIKDKLGYRAVSIPLSFVALVSVALLPATRHAHKLVYGLAVVLAVGAVGSQYALMPSAAQDSFGDKYASINIGFVYMSTVIATVSSALLSQHLSSLIGWDGMIALIASCACVDFLATWLMPAQPGRRLIKRYRQFYLNNNSNQRAAAAAAAPATGAGGSPPAPGSGKLVQVTTGSHRTQPPSAAA